MSMRNVRAVPTLHRGVRFASKGEAAMAALLDWLVVDRVVRWWTPAPKVYLGSAAHGYRPDFLVAFGPSLGAGEALFNGVVRAGEVVMVDFKGRTPRAGDEGDRLFRRNLKAWRAHGPCPLVITTRGGRGASVAWAERVEGADLDREPQSGCGGLLEVGR